MRFMVLSWCVVLVSTAAVSAGEPKPHEPGVWIAIPGERELLRIEKPIEGLITRDRPASPAAGMEHVTRSVNRELGDVARALRSLDQSYAIRGFQGCGAATAGSVCIDWHARGERRPHHVTVLPPEPIVLGIPKWRSICPDCRDVTAIEPKDCDCDRASERSPTPLPPAPKP